MTQFALTDVMFCKLAQRYRSLFGESDYVAQRAVNRRENAHFALAQADKFAYAVEVAKGAKLRN